MTRAFLSAWGGAFRDGLRFAAALPLLVALMIGIEGAQHVIEMRAGFFAADLATRQAASMDPLRLAFGWAKMITVFALGFFAIRHAVTGEARTMLRPTARALRRYAGVALFQAIITAVVIYAEPLLALAGIGKAHVLALRLTAGLFQQLAEPLLVLWYVNAAMGSACYGPVTSARATGWLYLWVLVLIFVTRLPFNAAHQMLNRWPAGKGPAVLWPALALDAVIVVAMVVVLAAVQVRIARYLAARRGQGLLDEAPAA